MSKNTEAVVLLDIDNTLTRTYEIFKYFFPEDIREIPYFMFKSENNPKAIELPKKFPLEYIEFNTRVIKFIDKLKDKYKVTVHLFTTRSKDDRNIDIIKQKLFKRYNISTSVDITDANITKKMEVIDSFSQLKNSDVIVIDDLDILEPFIAHLHAIYGNTYYVYPDIYLYASSKRISYLLKSDLEHLKFNKEVYDIAKT